MIIYLFLIFRTHSISHLLKNIIDCCLRRLSIANEFSLSAVDVRKR